MLKTLLYMIKGGCTCKGASAFLMDYVEGRLDAETAAKFEEHLDICPNCSMYLDQYRETIKLVKELEPPPVPPELQDHTCRFILESVGAEPED